jgi:nitrate reductase NapE component
VPQEVWDAAWNGIWPDDEDTIRWILEEYLDIEKANAHGYLELVIPLREQAHAAVNAVQSEAEEQERQIKIDADIDEVINTIQGLGLEPDEKRTASDSRGQNPSRKRNRWMRLAAMTITTFAIAGFAGFVGAYTFNVLNGAGDIRVSPSPEIRRAIPVEPEIRRAIPVQPETRKAIPMCTKTRDRATGLKSPTFSVNQRYAHNRN